MLFKKLLLKRTNMKKYLIALFVIILSGYSSDTRAWSYGEFISCNGMNSKPKIIFKTSYGQLIHDISTPKSTIQTIAAAQGNVPDKGYEIGGLATLQPLYTIKVNDARLKYLDETATCVLPKEIEIYFGFSKPVIYIPKELPHDSCRFSLTMRHEQTHQRINKLTLDYFLPLIKKTIIKTVYDVKAIKVSSPEEAQQGLAVLIQYYNAKISAILEEYNKARNAEQMKLDNLTNYSNEWEICKEFNKKHPPIKKELPKAAPF